MCARARDTTPPDGIPAGLFRRSTDAMHFLLCDFVEKTSASCSPGGDLSFLTLLLLMPCNCFHRERDLACQATSFCLQNRAWSSSGWADQVLVDALTRMERMA